MNIVFDLGGVVFNWQPDTLIRSVFKDAETQHLMKRDILGHPDWIELDRGTITLDEAIVRGASRTGRPRNVVARLFRAVPPSLTPIPESIDLIRQVRDAGNRVFVLSNMHYAVIAHLESAHRIWDLFDGIVISCRIHKVKPDIDIYEYLLNEYQLDATETIFIDDTSENLTAAESVGIRTIKFVDPLLCRQDLFAALNANE